MKYIKAVLIIVFVLFAFSLTSCEMDVDRKQYVTTHKDDRRTTTIEVFWLSEQQISEKCESLGTKGGVAYRGCARSKPGNPTICEIYAVRPKDFDDRESLYHFGHETWHCLGAKHN